MRGLKLAGIFAAGFISGLIFSFIPSNAVIADGGGGDGGGDSGGIAGGSNCIGDVAPSPNGNGLVNVEDLLAVIGHWGACIPPCNPTGSWSNAVAPIYSCASGTIQLHVQNWSFTQTGTTLRVSGGGLPGDMTGPAIVCDAGNNFLVTLSNPAGCIITYTLRGTFSSPTHFTGTFTVNFCGSGCTSCFNQSFNINATKQ